MPKEFLLVALLDCAKGDSQQVKSIRRNMSVFTILKLQKVHLKWIFKEHLFYQHVVTFASD